MRCNLSNVHPHMVGRRWVAQSATGPVGIFLRVLSHTACPVRTTQNQSEAISVGGADFGHSLNLSPKPDPRARHARRMHRPRDLSFVVGVSSGFAAGGLVMLALYSARVFVFRPRIRGDILGAAPSATLRGACGRPVGLAVRWSRTDLSPDWLVVMGFGSPHQGLCSCATRSIPGHDGIELVQAATSSPQAQTRVAAYAAKPSEPNGSRPAPEGANKNTDQRTARPTGRPQPRRGEDSQAAREAQLNSRRRDIGRARRLKITNPDSAEHLRACGLLGAAHFSPN